MHPCELSRILCSRNVNQAFIDNSYNFQFDSTNYLTIPYMNPGKQLSQEIYKSYNNFKY